MNRIEIKTKELERVQNAEAEAVGITKEAKYLSYPIEEVAGKLSSLAIEHGLEEDMEYYLDDVTKLQYKLESAFYRCEEVFADKARDLENELQDIEDKESEYDRVWRTWHVSKADRQG